MSQDQYGQARGSGYVVRGDIVPEEEAQENRDEQSRPLTRFQKVASALRGGSERDENDQADADRADADRADADRADAARADADQAAPEAPGANPPWVTGQDEAAMAGSPISREAEPKRDYWDEPAGGHDEPVAVTRPDVADPAASGTTGRLDDDTAPMPGIPPERTGAATIDDVAADAPAARAAGGRR